MGTLRRHGDGDDAVYTYSPLGEQQAYAAIDTGSLLLLVAQALRVVLRPPRLRRHHGVQHACRLVMEVARGRRALLTHDELVAAERQLPRGRGAHRASRDVIVHALYLAG